MNKPTLVLLIPVCTLLFACYPSHYRTVPGASGGELAKIRVHGSMQIVRIDGEEPPVSRLAMTPVRWDDFFITPGQHSFEVSYFRVRRGVEESSTRNQILTINLQPGDVKSLCPGIERNRLGRVTGWKPYVTEFPNHDPDSMWWQARYRRPKVPAECR